MAQATPDISYLVIGQIVGPRGVRGELKVRIETDDPARFAELDMVYVGPQKRAMGIRRSRLFKGRALLQLDGIQDANDAESLRDMFLYVAADQALPLGQDEYYHHQLIGLSVVTDQGQALGVIDDILVTGANDVYVVHGDGGEVLLPAIKQVIQSIDLDARLVTAHIIDGLLPE